MGKKSKKGKSNAQTKKKFSTQGPTKKPSKQSSEKYTVGQLLDKAEEYVDSFEYDLAQRFCKRALEIDSDHPRALEMTGTLLLELGDVESAKQCMGRAIEVQPDEGHSKYMYMGQLLTGAEAVECFQRGIELMTKALEESQKQELESACSSTQGTVNAKDLSSAYCSVAEIYLTDECFADDAEERCQTHLEKALELDDENAEAYQLMASFWLSKDEKQKAREMIDKGVALWLPLMKEADKADGDEIDPVQTCPVSYPARVNAAKILIEVEHLQCAIEVLELLLEEEEEFVEVWYLLGWAHYLQGAEGAVPARHYLHKALKVAKQIKYEEDEVLQHIADLLKELGPGEGDESNDEDVAAENGDMDVDSGSDDTDDENSEAEKEAAAKVNEDMQE